MKYSFGFLCTISCLSFVSSFIYPNEFLQFRIKYNKQYVNPMVEYTSNKNFQENLNIIRYLNNQNSELKLEINQFGDLTLDQFQKIHLMQKSFNHLSIQKYQQKYRPKYTSDLPNIDWNQLGYVRSVKQQGVCGSCWSFSTIGALESFVDIQYGIKEELSEQQLVDCSSSNYGCQGGMMHLAFQYILQSGGVVKSSDYPYQMKQYSCRINKTFLPLIETTRFKIGYVQPNDLLSLQTALSINPVCIGIDANSHEFMFYREGIYDKPLEKYPNLNHAILLTAMNNKDQIWTIKNSWGVDWGLNGYMNIRMKSLTGVGGMNQYCILPIHPTLELNKN